MSTQQEVMSFVEGVVERLKAQSRTPEYQALAAKREIAFAEIQKNRERAEAQERERDRRHQKSLNNRTDWDEQRRKRQEGFHRMRPTQGEPITRKWIENYVQPLIPTCSPKDIPATWGREALSFGLHRVRIRLEKNPKVTDQERFDTMMRAAIYHRSGKKAVYGTWQDAQDRPEDVLPWRRDIDDPFPEEEAPSEPWSAPQSKSWRARR